MATFREHTRAENHRRSRLGKAASLCLACFAVGLLPGAQATAQISLTYGTLDPDLDDDGLGGSAIDWTREYITLDYGVPLSDNLTLGSSLGLVGEEQTPITTILTNPDGLSLGLWGRYDLLSYSAGNTYADGGLTYLDYDLENSNTPNEGNELKFSLGLGADLALSDRVSAFTNFNYTYVDGRQDGTAYEGGGQGLEIGIEIEF